MWERDGGGGVGGDGGESIMDQICMTTLTNAPQNYLSGINSSNLSHL